MRRREMEMHVGVRLAPRLLLHAVGAQVVENDMQFLARRRRHQPVHELQKLHPPLAFEMAAEHLPGGHVERGKKGAGAVPLVFVGKAGERPPVGHFQPALRPLQGLDAGLLVKT